VWIGIVALVVLAGVLAGAMRLRQGGTQPKVNSLAVLPFTQSAAQGTDEYLTDGITEGVINDLSQVPGLRVMSRSTVFRFKGNENDPQQVGSALKVEAVVTGRVTQRNDNFTVQTELVKVADGTQMWGQQFTRKMQDVSSLQGDIAREIISRLRMHSASEEKQVVARPGTQNQEAYRVFLKGRFYLAQRTEASVKEAIDNYRQAVALDPTYAQAWASLALAYDLARGYLPREQLKTLPTGKAEAEKALQLDAALSEGHLALATIDTSLFDWVTAEHEFKLAQQINPNDASAHYLYAHTCLLPQKRYDEAMSEYHKALELDPLSGIINTNLGFGLFIARRFDEAREQYRKTLELDPHFEVALYRSQELEAYLGNYEASRQLLIRYLPGAATIDFGTGKEGYFQAMLKLRSHEGDFGLNTAMDDAMLGKKDDAFQVLNREFQTDPGDMVTWIWRPELDSLRSDTRYVELLHRMNLRP
jgi:TolB-like protein/tetratricopeptide (TPR) repeat protein